MELQTLTNNELVGIHNGLNPDKPLKAWKGKKTVLIEKIESLQISIAKQDSINNEPEEHTSVEPENDEILEVTETEPADDAKPEQTRKATGNTIRATAVKLLMVRQYYEDKTEKPGPDNHVSMDHTNARGVGIPYDEVLAQIHEDFPGCKTSVACLRWYMVKIVAEEFGYEDQPWQNMRRPRSKPKKS
jgi:hypothetical protein